MTTAITQEVTIEGLKIALRRAAGAIQAMYAGTGKSGINGEAIRALAIADQQEGERWETAVEKARTKLAGDWPSTRMMP